MCSFHLHPYIIEWLSIQSLAKGPLSKPFICAMFKDIVCFNRKLQVKVNLVFVFCLLYLIPYLISQYNALFPYLHKSVMSC